MNDKPFPPTFLYIKRHSITGKCYFGKTTKNPIKYAGSGVHWVRHLKIHGKKFVETLWYKLFYTQEECSRVALLFSYQQDIVNSSLWLNIVPEDGCAGGQNKGIKHSLETRAKISAKNKLRPSPFKGRKHSKESLLKMSEIHSGKKQSQETINKRVDKNKGKKRSTGFCETQSLNRTNTKYRIKVCPYCGKEGGNNMPRYHFENCKHKKE